MDIYPEDLEPVYHSQIQKERETQGRKLPDGTFAEAGLNSTFGGAFGSFFGFVSFIFWETNGGNSIPVLISISVLIAGMGVCGSLGYACGFFVDRNHRSKQRAKPVMGEEIGLISKAETDALRIEYLNLISKLIIMRVFQNKTVEQSIRNAIRNIGSSVANLPSQPSEELLLDAKTFQAEASRLAAEAAQETDTVVAASLQRQAAAQSQRADTISRNSALARRNQILRHEMVGHIKALKIMLDSMALDDKSSNYDLAALAENIQQVADEAHSLTEAKKELASVLDQGYASRASVIPEQTPLFKLSGQE